MRFWDASAVVALLVPENRSSDCTRELADDPAMIVWALEGLGKDKPAEVLVREKDRLRRRARSGSPLQSPRPPNRSPWPALGRTPLL
jgi:hypothetical protein